MELFDSMIFSLLLKLPKINLKIPSILPKILNIARKEMDLFYFNIAAA